MNDVCNACLRSALNLDRARVQFHPQISSCAEASRYLLDPVTALAIDAIFLTQGQGRQRCDYNSDAGEFYSLPQLRSSQTAVRQ